MPKNVLNINTIDAHVMSSTLEGDAIDVRYLDNIYVQTVSDYDDTAPQGNLIVYGSNDHKEYFGEVVNEGNWIVLLTIPLTSTFGTFGNDLTAFAMAYVKTSYISTYSNSFTITATGNAAGVLNNKYFFMDDVYGLYPNPQASFYVWYNSDGLGTDPAIEGRTGIEVDVQAGDADSDVAQNTSDAISAVTNYFTASPSGADVVVGTKVAGGGSAVDHNTGFAITVDTSDGVLSVYLSAKAV